MALTLRENYSGLVLEKLRKDLVLKDDIIFNTNFEGDALAGAVKIYMDDDEANVRDYNTASGLQGETVDNSYLTVYVNKDKGINIVLDGYEIEAVSPDVVAERMGSATYSLGLQLDKDGGAELVTGGTAQNITTLSSSNIYSEVVKLRVQMDKLNIPKQGRWLIVTPDTYGLLLNSEQFIKASQLGDEVVQSGIVGRIAGFNVVENNDSTANLAMIAGTPKFATRIKAWKVAPMLVSLDGSADYIGASALKARMVYAHKVTRANCIIPVFSPSTISGTLTALTGDDAGKYKVTCSALDSGTLKYKVITDGTMPAYGIGDTGYTSFTSNSTKITASSGNIIAVGEFNSDSKLTAVCLISIP